MSSAWTLDHGQFIPRLDIPEGVTAGVEMPDGTRYAAAAGEHEFRAMGSSPTVLAEARRPVGPIESCQWTVN
ncbi:hypothetical protein LFT48_09400 [Arthrobacter sp. FW305-123]|nr:hypothetical protein LFT48_09400 [Arthrobacter sp. FW305-123]